MKNTVSAIIVKASEKSVVDRIHSMIESTDREVSNEANMAMIDINILRNCRDGMILGQERLSQVSDFLNRVIFQVDARASA